MRELIERSIKHSIETKQALLQSGVNEIERAGLMIADALKNGRKLLICGNGGSSSDAQHIAAELVIRFKSSNNRRALPAMALNADSAALTAGANDLGYDSVFARQIEAFGGDGDVFLGITTSGNSSNIIQALAEAKRKGMKTILLTGRTGGKIASNHGEDVDLMVLVPADETARIQESHILIGHIICSIIEKELFDLI